MFGQPRQRAKRAGAYEGVAGRHSAAELMPMAAIPVAVKATESEPSERREEVGTEVMMVPSAVAVAIMPKAPAVDLLHQRRGLYLLSHPSNGSCCRRTRHQPQAKRASDSAEQCCLPHSCLMCVMAVWMPRA